MSGKIGNSDQTENPTIEERRTKGKEKKKKELSDLDKTSHADSPDQVPN